jgi:flagellin-like protein
MNKKAISPLFATFLLLVFAIILGTIVMNIGRDYVEGIVEIEEPTIEELQSPLEILNVRYAKGEITTAEYEEMKSRIS